MDLRGQMMFEWQAGCAAYTTNHHFTLAYEYADSAPLKITSDFTTYEMRDGHEFDFISRRHRDGQLYEELRGTAKRAWNGALKISYTTPPDLSFDTKPGVLFPIAHTQELLRAIKEKKKIFHAVVFDGSDDEGPVEINAVISGPLAHAPVQASSDTTIDAGLLQSPAWNVRMAFFPLSSDETQSDYEMDLVMHENGVISDMRVHYSDFSVTQKLAALEKTPAEECGKPAKSQNDGKKSSLWDIFRQGFDNPAEGR